jgi:hypothetical protein
MVMEDEMGGGCSKHGETINAHRLQVVETEGKPPFWRLRHTRADLFGKCIQT